MATPPFKVKAVYEYSSPHDDDLHFPNGQIITVTENEEEDWYTGEYVDTSGVKQEGIFPRNFVEKYEPTAPPRPNRAARPKKEEAQATSAESSAEAEPVTNQLPPREQKPVPVVAAEASVPVQAPPQQREPPASIPVPAPVSRSVESPSATTLASSKPAPPTSKATIPTPADEKPSGGSFRDRIAAFNKPAAAPVAPFKPSGHGGAGSGFIKKPFVAPPPSKDAYVPPPMRELAPQKIYRRDEDPEIAAQESETRELAEKAGFGASPPATEAEEGDQPKPTSLKERIALLQQQQMEQAQRHAEAASKKEKPKKPVKKRIDTAESAAVLEGEEGPDPERHESHDVTVSRNVESASDDLPARAPMPRRRSSKGPPPVPLAREAFGDGNEADMSGAGDETEELDEISTSRDDSDEKPRNRAPLPLARAPAAPLREPDVGEEEGAAEEEEELAPRATDMEDRGVEDDDQDNEDDEDDEEVDPEVRRKEELRARMAKMSGGMGMHGMFGAPGGMPMPMPAAAPAKKKTASESSQKRMVEEPPSDVASVGRAPPVPMPGMSRGKSSEEVPAAQVEREVSEYTNITSTTPAEMITDVEDIRTAPLPPMRTTNDRSSQPAVANIVQSRAPPVPGSRPLPPPIPSECECQSTTREPGLTMQARPQIATNLPMSPSAGSESDDEMSMVQPKLSLRTPVNDVPDRTLPQYGDSPSSLSRPQGPISPRSPPISKASYFGNEASPSSPTTPGALKRMSRVPPIPGSSPAMPSSQARAPPPPPPSAIPSLSRTSTGDARPPPPPAPFESEENDDEDEEEVTEYEGDYDTDIASAVPHKDALKGHARDSSFEDASSLKSPVMSPNTLPPALPTSVAPRNMPPMSSQPPQLPAARQSTDTPRAAPPPPPPTRDNPVGADVEDYDPFNYSAPPRPSAPTPNVMRQRTEEDLYSAVSTTMNVPMAQDRAAPPPPPPHEPMSTSLSSTSMPAARQSIDVQRAQSNIRRSTELGRMSMDTGYMATDIDLGIGTRWWTQSNAIPPTLQDRGDILYEVEESTSTKRGGKTTVSKDVYVLYQDYSQTVISALFDPQDPGAAKVEQRHEQPPSRLRQDQLEQAYERFGRRIGEAVTKQKDSVVGDGSPHSLITELLKPHTAALLPVGTRAYGALVYGNLANASTSQFDEIRPGDIITLRNAKFQGKHGAMHAKYSMEVGQGNGHVGVVAEWDGTKKKVRAWEQGRESKKVRLESFKLDDLRSGEVKIWRVMPRSWVGWEGGN